MVFEQEDSGIELYTNVYDIVRYEGYKLVFAKFTFSAAPSNNNILILMASGEMKIHIGQSSPSLLCTPPTSEREHEWTQLARIGGGLSSATNLCIHGLADPLSPADNQVKRWLLILAAWR